METELIPTADHYGRGKSRAERTGWRDSRLSQRHREWGAKLPCTDMDFILIERDLGFPKAIVEYKHECADPSNYSTEDHKAISILCNNSKIPFFGVMYDATFARFAVVPINTIAKMHLGEPRIMSETEYVTLLHKLKGKSVPQGVLKWILDH